jgi:hypothetical protein
MMQNCKPETRNPKFETISNDKKTKASNNLDAALSFGFGISNFEIVSDFDIRISN